MTFEEILQTIEGMLAVQKELQGGQLRIQENQIAIQRAQEADRQQFQQILAIARELQQRQIQLQDTQERERETIGIMVEEMNRLIELSNRHERRIEQLIGYSITNEGEHLDIEERFRVLEARVQKLESRN